MAEVAILIELVSIMTFMFKISSELWWSNAIENGGVLNNTYHVGIYSVFGVLSVIFLGIACW
jgi:hypothetical protein